MIEERSERRFSTITQALDYVAVKGYSVEFIINETGFLDKSKGNTYVPECIKKIQVYRMLNRASKNGRYTLLYLLLTIDNQRGWVIITDSDSPDRNLADHLFRINENLKK